MKTEDTTKTLGKVKDAKGIEWNILFETENGYYCVSNNGYVERLIPKQKVMNNENDKKIFSDGVRYSGSSK